VTTYLTIGEFSQRTRLSPKALRLYGELGLLLPDHVDPDSGYRFYREDQIEPARLVAQLRRLDMPLATIGELLALDGAEAAQALASWSDGVEATGAERRSMVAYLQARLLGEEHTVYDIDVRRLPERAGLDQPPRRRVRHRRVLRRGLHPSARRRPRPPRAYRSSSSTAR
jgi:DNA-binding transcriptional MerR regulator